MIDSLYIAASGMNAQQTSVDTIANNLANVNTPGFKKARVSFQDMMYREVARSALPGAASDGGTSRMGSGVSVAGIARAFEAGELKRTDSPFDLAIRGDGFVEVTTVDGSSAYTRGGTLQVNREGLLANAQGLPLKAAIRVPDDAQALSIGSDGRVLARVGTQTAAMEIGRIDLARFGNAAALVPMGDNLFRPSEGSGDARSVRPGEEGAGTLAQGYLEGSNVKLIEEMVELMVAQRAYEVSTKVIQASDEMMAMTNNLRRGS
jgi:flagellar basal-body rod protein FlgG